MPALCPSRDSDFPQSRFCAKTFDLPTLTNLLRIPSLCSKWVDTTDDTAFTLHPDGSSMYLIFIKEPRFTHPLERRKVGVGGRGKGPSSSSSALSDSLLIIHDHHSSSFYLPAHVGESRGSGSSKSGNPSKVPLGSGSLPNGKKSATSYGAEGGRAAPIPLGRPFAGRIAGGGNGIKSMETGMHSHVRFSNSASLVLTCYVTVKADYNDTRTRTVIRTSLSPAANYSHVE